MIQPITRQSMLYTCIFFLSLMGGTPACAQGSILSPNTVDRRIDPLSAIDLQFMAAQRADVEALANRLGKQLTGDPDRDLETLQRILDLGLVSPEDTLQLQALGVVLGDLFAAELNMDWVVYRDRAGRSRALRYRDSETFLFPVTMISRRWEVGHQRDVSDIYHTNVSKTQAQLPGANWR
ncbi:MAG: DUF3806 domain-containing protein [Luminiphilus sp.]|nr:DUF3806 domain-containing protein [Luminiphilus sp.]